LLVYTCNTGVNIVGGSADICRADVMATVIGATDHLDIGAECTTLTGPGRPRYLIDVRNPIHEPRKPDFLV